MKYGTLFMPMTLFTKLNFPDPFFFGFQKVVCLNQVKLWKFISFNVAVSIFQRSNTRV